MSESALVKMLSRSVCVCVCVCLLVRLRMCVRVLVYCACVFSYEMFIVDGNGRQTKLGWVVLKSSKVV